MSQNRKASADLKDKIYGVVHASVKGVRPDTNLYSDAAVEEIVKRITSDVYEELVDFFMEDNEPEEDIFLIEE